MSDQLKMHSKDLTQDNLKKIRALFPNCVTEVQDSSGGGLRLAIDFDLLRQELASEIVEGPQERYRLDWPGKREAMLIANSPIAKTLRPARNESVHFDNTENLFIEGDNLEALKLLQENYLGKIKMIYIDPPYNTRNDFIYNDDFAQTADEYFQNSLQQDEQGNRLTTNTEATGRFHSKWLSMMLSRLRLAKNLLRDDGTLLISIDDHEQASLKKLCDEVFGTRNVEVMVWNKEAEGSSGKLKAVRTFRRIHEYVIACHKDIMYSQWQKINEALIGREDEFQTANLAVNIANESREHPNYFTITNPSGLTFTRQWKWDQQTIEQLISEDLIYWGSDGQKQPRLIIPLDERRQTFLLSILNYGGTTTGRKDFELLFGPDIEFSYPKPVVLLQKLMRSITQDSDIVLDFFAGSATTADALLRLNAEDGGNRKFIMVQLPEIIDSNTEAFRAGYETIVEISKERIRRVGELLLKTESNENWRRDIGFRVLKVDSSNMKDTYYHPTETAQESLMGFISPIKEGRTSEDLLFQVMLDLGLELTLPIHRKVVDNKEVFFVDKDLLVACFEPNISEALILELTQHRPLRVVFADACFGNDDSLKTNAQQIFRQQSPDTSVVGFR